MDYTTDYSIRPTRLVAATATGPFYTVQTDERAEKLVLPEVLANGWQVMESARGWRYLARPFGAAEWFASWDAYTYRVEVREIATVVVDGVIWGALGDAPRHGYRYRTRADNLH